MNRFMKMAINEARKGILKNDGGPFGAVIVKDGKVVAKAHNQVIAKNDATCHGEINAIRKAGKNIGTFDLSGCEIYTTGYPCPMCMCAILWSNIKRVYFGCNIDDTSMIGFRDKKFDESMDKIEERVCKELDRSNCLELYAEYKKIKDKTRY